MARGHALGDVGNNFGNAADDIGRKDLVGMKHAQKTCPLFSDIRRRHHKDYERTRKLVPAAPPSHPALYIVSRSFRPEFHNTDKTIG